jgi:hypothetical protein
MTARENADDAHKHRVVMVDKEVAKFIETLMGAVDRGDNLLDEQIERMKVLAPKVVAMGQMLTASRAETADLALEVDTAYRERNALVAALARHYPSGIRKTDIPGWDPCWHNCVFIDTQEGQMSWHYHDSDARLFAGLPPYEKPWDGHTTPEKYERLNRLARIDWNKEILAETEQRATGWQAEAERLTLEVERLRGELETLRANVVALDLEQPIAQLTACESKCQALTEQLAEATGLLEWCRSVIKRDPDQVRLDRKVREFLSRAPAQGAEPSACEDCGSRTKDALGGCKSCGRIAALEDSLQREQCLEIEQTAKLKSAEAELAVLRRRGTPSGHVVALEAELQSAESKLAAVAEVVRKWWNLRQGRGSEANMHMHNIRALLAPSQGEGGGSNG